jgi:trk system potassium uptake protein
VEMLVPERLHNHTLANANLPQRYGLTVLAIRRQGQFRFNPPENTVLLPGDEMLVAGSITSAQRLSG